MEPSNVTHTLSLLLNTEQHGGIKSLSSSLFELDEGVREIFKNYNITTKEGLMSVILMVHAFGDTNHVVFLFEEGLRLGIITKTDVIHLYLMQDKEARAYRPILTFEMMSRMSQFAFPQKRGVGNIVPVEWITKEEMLVLANQVISVSHSDLYTIFQQWFYRNDDELPLSREFFEYWYEIIGSTHGRIDGKIASLLVIAYQKKYPGSVSLEDVIKRYTKLCNENPESHGTIRYLSLCFWIAGDCGKNKQKIVDAWTASIISMLYRGRSLYRGTQFSIELLIREENISIESKHFALLKIQKAADDIAKEYTNIVDEAHKMVREL